jgi:hypothetical protein
MLRREVVLLQALACIAALPADTCGRGSFATDLTGWQCFGLGPVPSATSEGECIKACCDMGPTDCEVWQFCDQDCGSEDEVGGCWVGKKQHCRLYPGWIGGGNLPEFSCPYSNGWNFNNRETATLTAQSEAECCAICNTAQCQAWTWDYFTNECVLKEWDDYPRPIVAQSAMSYGWGPNTDCISVGSHYCNR